MGLGSVTEPDYHPMQEGINEVIATSNLNAAPMGIINRNGRLMMAVYRTSHTASNIERDCFFVANISHDPVLFVRTAFNDLPPEEFIEDVIEGRKVSRLRDCPSWVLYAARVDQKTGQKILFVLDPIKKYLALSQMIPVNRGFNSVIEAAVHGTRYIFTKDPSLKQLIDHHADLVHRCGGRRDLEALALLYQYISEP
ncbi:MAG TPA: DUF447 domain-containing protein [Methanospirillum sp.]|nr:DUF447 domain-containing protein [Methanospirillum sp.]